MKISDFAETELLEEQIKALTLEREDRPKIEHLKKQWKVSTHRTIVDKEFLPDKEIKNADGEFVKYKKVNRLAVPFQKLIVNSAVTFSFGNEVEIIAEFQPKSEEEKVFDIIKKILEDNKIAVHNRKIAKECYRASEVAELWYYEKTTEPHEDYGFPCDFKVRVKLITPWNGDVLHPHFDAYDKMRAFARSYAIQEKGKAVEMMDIFTDEEYKTLKKINGVWQEVSRLDFSKTINKIPLIYAQQEGAE